jgi:hypothetical protein
VIEVKEDVHDLGWAIHHARWVFLGNVILPYRVKRMDDVVNWRMKVHDLRGGHLILKMDFVGSEVFVVVEGNDCVTLVQMVGVKLHLDKHPQLPWMKSSNRIRGKFYVLSYSHDLDHS